MFGYYYVTSKPGVSPDAYKTEDGLGKGKGNTDKLLGTADNRYDDTKIEAKKVVNFAPEVASEYKTESITTGWFLPSLAELKLMWEMKTELDMNAETYLSSTEDGSNYVVSTKDLASYGNEKYISGKTKASVRAVRAL